MKKFKKVFAVLLLMLLVTAPVVTAATQPVTVEAAAQEKNQTEKSQKASITLTKTERKSATNGVPLK